MGFLLLWTSWICCRILVTSKNAASHWGVEQQNPFTFSWTAIICRFNNLLKLNFFPHWSQLSLRSLCLLTCFSSWAGLEIYFLQTWHMWPLLLLCIFRWEFKAYWCVNVFPQIWQFSRPSPVWSLIWYLSFCFFENTTSFFTCMSGNCKLPCHWMSFHRIHIYKVLSQGESSHASSSCSSAQTL